MTGIKKTGGLICVLAAVVLLSGCIESNNHGAYMSEEKIVRPPGATDLDVVKSEIKSITQSDGPRGIVLFFNSMGDEGNLVLDAKADEPSDFVDVIAAIAIIDKRLAAQDISINKYTIKYSGMYIPSKGEFDITAPSLGKIAKDAKDIGLVDSVIDRMINNDFGEQVKFFGMAADKHYSPSCDKTDMYLGYERAPDLTIRIV